MAFKQKAGSPFQRNFGIGKSPVKQTSPMKDTKVAEVDREPDAVHKDRIKHDPETDEHVFPMKSPVKHKADATTKIYNENHPGPGLNIEEESQYHTGHDKDGNPIPMKKSGFKMKSSPFQKFGEIVDVDVDTGVETQISSSDVKQEKDDIAAAKAHIAELKEQNPTSSVEFLNEQADIFLYELNPEKYGQFGYSKGTGRTDVEFRGLEKYTNELSPHYDADIKTVQDIKDKYEVVDEAGGLVVRDSEAFDAIAWEEKPGAKEKTESQKQLDRDALLEEEG